MSTGETTFYRAEGVLTASSVKSHVTHVVEVGTDVNQLSVRFHYETAAPNVTHMTLTLFDPAGFRGEGHRQSLLHEVVLGPDSATPGFLPGKIQSGRWLAVINIHMIVSPDVVHYTLDVSGSASAMHAERLHMLPRVHPKSRGAGWYRGDLHAHTIHSDARWDVPDLVEAARKRGLDFVTLTDHNTIAPLAEMKSLGSESLLTLGGMELTTYYGHALALGVDHWIDWRARSGGRAMADIAADVEASGGLFVIAHPRSPGDPLCTGCAWLYEDVMPGKARFVEVWNGGTWMDYNEGSLALWYEWLNAGHHLVATAGTDRHGPEFEEIPIGFNVVYAEDLSETAIWAAIRKGHMYLSSGPQLEFTAGSARMGDTLATASADLFIACDKAERSDQLRLIARGKVHAEFPVTTSGKEQHAVHIQAEQSNWFVVELRAPNGELRAVTNPIYLSGR